MIFAQDASLPLRLKLLKLIGRQTWIPKGQDKLLRAIWNPDGFKDYWFETDFFGFRWRGNLAVLLDWCVFCYGSYSYYELLLLHDIAKFLRQKSQPPVNFFDIGANLGQHSLYMSRYADQVFAFEPYFKLQRIIEEKIVMNKLKNIRIVPVALGDADETLRYFPGSSDNPGAGSLVSGHSGLSGDDVTKVQVRAGDRLFDEEGLPKIDLMKVDVEEFELEVLRGLRSRIQRDRPPVLIELSARTYERTKTESNLRDFFFEEAIFKEVVGRHGCGYTLRPFQFGHSHEVLVLPPESASFLASRDQASKPEKK